MDDDDLRDIFSPFGTVAIRRMFGGKGIYVDGVIVALIVDGELLLKADPESRAAFAEAGARQWTYEAAGGKTAAMPYWSVPDAALDDPDLMRGWAGLAVDAGRRAPPKKPRPARR